MDHTQIKSNRKMLFGGI